MVAYCIRGAVVTVIVAVSSELEAREDWKISYHITLYIWSRKDGTLGKVGSKVGSAPRGLKDQAGS